MTSFGLIHGGGMGAWCWERVIPELERRGCTVAVVDLPVDDDAAGLDEYARFCAQAFVDLDEPIVVGHSLGGLVVPLVAAELAARRMVFLCAMVPEPGRSAAQQLAPDPTMVAAEIAPGGNDTDIEPATPEQAIALLYQDCTHADALWALSQMRRQSDVPWRQPNPLAVWPGIASTYIVGADDRCVLPTWGRGVSIGRLGAPAVELPTGHSPFVSAPQLLADALLALSA
jgi:pimeloyl-ACP methyl ester carboxylesterase